MSLILGKRAVALSVAVFFAATFSSKAGELNALGATTTVDLYRHVIRRDATDAHYVTASKWFTALWGLVAGTAATLLFALIFGGKYPKPDDWISLVFILVAMRFLALAEKKRVQELVAEHEIDVAPAPAKA